MSTEGRDAVAARESCRLFRLRQRARRLRRDWDAAVCAGLPGWRLALIERDAARLAEHLGRSLVPIDANGEPGSWEED
jgi:hypothetical protein